MIKRHLKQAGFIAALFTCISMLNTAHAAVVSYTFLDGLSESHTLSYDDPTGAYTADLSAWATTGPGIDLDATIQAATAHEMTDGLGVCNNTEGDFATCLSGNKRPAIGNAGEYEWILVVLPEVSKIDSFTVYSDGNTKVDVTYFTGWINPVTESDLTGLTVADFSADRSLGGLGLTQYDVDNGQVRVPGPVDIDLATSPAFVGGGTGDVWGNAILIGASTSSGGVQVMLNSVTTTVPLPAGAWLFISAIGALAARRKLRA